MTSTAIESYLNKAAECTNYNNHTGAIKVMATYVCKKHNQLLEVSNLAAYCDAIDKLHEFYGHMPSELRKIREDLTASIESLLNDSERALFHATR